MNVRVVPYVEFIYNATQADQFHFSKYAVAFREYKETTAIVGVAIIHVSAEY